MEVISINGVEYIKASLLARQFKYTADYIGQLCRGRKVDAKLVGRTWYVNPLSLKTHQVNRHAKNLPDEKTIDTNLEMHDQKVSVGPVVRKPIVRPVSQGSQVAHFAKRIQWKPVKYETDDADLLPTLGANAETTTKLPVELAEAHSIVLKDNQKPIIMVADTLPEVSLSGTLIVKSLEDNFENIDKNIAIPDEKLEMEEPEKINYPSLTTLVKEKTYRERPMTSADRKVTYPVEIKTGESSQHVVLERKQTLVKPISSSRVSLEEEETVVADTDAGISWVWWITLGVSLLVLLAVLCLEVTVVASVTDYQFGLDFSFPEVTK